MSNIIKPVYFNVDKNNKKVIDNDSLLLEKPEFAKKDSLPEDFDFIPGINVINIDDIIEEHKNNAADNASEIVMNARAEADRIIEEARQSAELIKREAHDEGFNQGLDEGRKAAEAELESAKQELADREECMQAEYNDIINDIEPQFAAVVGELIEKITGVLIEDRDVFHYLIDRTIRELPVSDKYVIHVCTEDFGSVNMNRDKLAESVPSDAGFEIIEDEMLEKNKCMVETSTHMIDCSLDVQMENLKKELRLLSIS